MSGPPPPPARAGRTFALAARVWRLSLRPRWPTVAVATALMTAVALINGAQALVVEWVGGLIESQRAQSLWPAIVVIVGVGVAKAGALFGQVVVTQRLAFKIIQDLQSAMYAAFLRADFARVSGEAGGALVSRFISDVERVREGVVRSATNLGRDLLTVVVMIGVMFYFDWMLTLLVLGVYPLIFKPVLDVGRRVRTAATRAQEQMGGLSAFLSETFAGVRLVKTFRLEARQKAKGDAAFEERFDLSMKIARGRASVEPLLEAVGALAFAGIVAFAAWRISTGGFPIQTLLGFIAALAIMAPAARALGTLNAVIQEGMAALDRVFAVLDEIPHIVDAPGAKPLQLAAGEVRLDDVRFAYPDGSLALDGVSLVAEAGATTALVGPSGAGKSTILNLIPRLYDVADGAVAVDGQDTRAVSLSSLRGAIGLVSQDVTLFDDTVRANVAFGRLDATDAEVWDALDAAAAREFVEALPGGLDSPVGERGGLLSGGQRQRLALARAVLKDAPILLLDEATSALDAESEAKVQQALERLSKGRTTIVIAHRLATVRNADKIVVLDQGKVVEEGDDATLKSGGGVYERLRRLQFAADAAE